MSGVLLGIVLTCSVLALFFSIGASMAVQTVKREVSEVRADVIRAVEAVRVETRRFTDIVTKEMHGVTKAGEELKRLTDLMTESRPSAELKIFPGGMDDEDD